MKTGEDFHNFFWREIEKRKPYYSWAELPAISQKAWNNFAAFMISLKGT